MAAASAALGPSPSGHGNAGAASEREAGDPGRSHRIGRMFSWLAGGMGGLFVVYAVLGLGSGFLPPSIQYWPFWVGIPVALVLGTVMPVLGLIGAGMAWRIRRDWLPGAASVALATVLWILVLTAPTPGI